MEVAALLGASALLAVTLSSTDRAVPTQLTPEQEASLKLETNRESLMHQFREVGMIAPQYNSVPARRPWDTTNPPFYLDEKGPHHMDSPTERMYAKYTNSVEHHRADKMEQISRARQSYARTRGNAWYTGFTDEMSMLQKNGEWTTTNIQEQRFLPKNPDDSDYNYAAAMAKMLPADPTLFTPESDYSNAPGLPFRYAASGNK